MTVGMKVSLVVIVLFGAVLAFYYGLGTPNATPDGAQPEPAPKALEPTKATTIIPERGMVNARPRFFGDSAQRSEGVLSKSVERAVGTVTKPVDERHRAEAQRANVLSQKTTSTTPTVTAKNDHADNAVEPEVPAIDPLAKNNYTSRLNTPSPSARTVSYTVKENDSLWTIAEDWFGEAGRWDLIAKANPLIDPDRLKPGQVIRLPAKDAVRRPVRPARTTPTDPGAYVVRSGDSLSRIARVFYGDESKWPIIYKANRATIGSDPAKLSVGTRLHIPPRSL